MRGNLRGTKKVLILSLSKDAEANMQRILKTLSQ